MWKRFNKEKDRLIGNPILVDTTYDGKALGKIPHVSDVQASGAIPRGVIGNTSPRGQPRISTVPTVSSVYSQPSEGWRDSIASSQYTTQPDDSPPISPVDESVPQLPGSSQDRDVSPVEDPTGGPYHGQRDPASPPSRIPQARKSSSNQNSQKADVERFWRRPASGKVKWDVYSGEPTTSDRGKEGSVKPGTFTPSLRPTGSKHSRNDPANASENDSQKLTLAERTSRLGARGLSIETNARPEWKGASGRAPLVQPVKDRPTKQAFTVPRKARQALSPVMSDDSGQDTPTSATARAAPPALEVSSEQRDYRRDEDIEIKPTVPLKAGLNSPTSATRPIGHPYPSPITPRDPYKPHTNDVPSPPPDVRPSILTGDIDGASAHRASSEVPNSFPHVNEGELSNSRFSWTTYATNTTYQHSPPPSPPPPLPTVIPAPSSAPIVSRRRPVPSTTGAVPAALPSPMIRSPSPTSTVRTTATSATAKTLPRPPPEVQSVDLISNLQAQMDDLEVRRNNIRRLIRDFTKTQAASPLRVDLTTRRDNARKLKEFEDELAEIGNLEHDVGLRLHRAYKRRERDAPEESTTLWIRRVTS